MTITLVRGKGSGQTHIGAFDAALHDAGVSNYNLIALSSIIPPDSKVKIAKRYSTPTEDWGKRLYVVKAEQRSDIPNTPIASGIGWLYVGNKGLFVEHELAGLPNQTEANLKKQIKELIHKSLEDLCMHRQIVFHKDKINSAIHSTTVKKQPACVLTLAVYQADPW